MTPTPMLAWVRDVLCADAVSPPERVQSLWGGYGEIVRVRVAGADVETAIVKRVEPSTGRGRSHARKLRSYEVERAFYAGRAARCDDACRVPRCFAAERTPTGWRFVLEDLDAAGFPGRRSAVTADELDRCLAWLASFHARFFGEPTEGLWDTGTYWHLATRPDELARIDEPALREAALAIDARLSACAHRTLVHGDAKLANFCFAPDGARVAAVDFQYVGGGPGVKDVAYLLFAAHGWGARVTRADAHLDAYFAHLRAALARDRPSVDAGAVEREWRALYPLGAADFHRFLAGWSPGRASLRDFRASLTDEVRRALR